MNELKKIERDENFLIKGFPYIFDDRGNVDWRALVPKEYLYINPQNKERIEKKYNKKYEELDVINDKIEDRDLVILLAGLKFLSQIRGYSSVQYTPVIASQDYAATKCSILWDGNYETLGKPILFESLSCAHTGNTNGFGRLYLIELCENRAFARNIRSFLQINIVSREEIQGADFDESSNSNGDSGPNPTIILQNLMNKKNKTFDQIKKKCFEDGYAAAQDWQSLNDIPKSKIFDIVEKLKKLKDV